MGKLKLSLLVSGLTLLVVGFQNCSKYQFADAQVASGKSTGLGTDGLPLPSVAGGGSDTPAGTGATGLPTPAEVEARDWLSANCDESQIRQKPISLSFSASGGSVSVSQISQSSIEISDKKSVRAQQLTAGTLVIKKTELLEIQQVQAEKISIEALVINKIQQMHADEIRVHANSVDAFQQISAVSTSGTKLQLIAKTANTIQQVSTLCLRTNSTQKIQQVAFVKVFGDGADAKVDQIQQVEELSIIDAEVDSIQQVHILVLKNSKVKRVHQVQKLVLINSSVEEMSQVSEVVEQ